MSTTRTPKSKTATKTVKRAVASKAIQTTAKSGSLGLVSLRDHVDRLEKRLRNNQSDNRKTLKELKTSFESLNDTALSNDQSVDMSQYLERVSIHMNALIDQTRADIAHDLGVVMEDPRFETLSAAITRANKRLSQTEAAQKAQIATVNGNIANLAKALAADLDMRFEREEKSRNDADKALETRLQTRLEEIESHTGEAVSNIGDKIVEVSDELMTRSDSIKQELGEQALNLGQNYEEHKSEIARRIESIEDDQRNSIPSIERRLVTLATRLEILEGSALPTDQPTALGETFEPAELTATPEAKQTSAIPDLVPEGEDAFSVQSQNQSHVVTPPNNPYAPTDPQAKQDDTPFSLQEYTPPVDTPDRRISNIAIRNNMQNRRETDTEINDHANNRQVNKGGANKDGANHDTGFDYTNPYQSNRGQNNRGQNNRGQNNQSQDNLGQNSTQGNVAFDLDSDNALELIDPIQSTSNVAPPPFMNAVDTLHQNIGAEISGNCVDALGLDNNQAFEIDRALSHDQALTHDQALSHDQAMSDARPGHDGTAKLSRSEKAKTKKREKAERSHAKKLAKQIAKQEKSKAKQALKNANMAIAPVANASEEFAALEAAGAITAEPAKRKSLLSSGPVRTTALMVGVSVAGLMVAKNVIPGFLEGAPTPSKQVGTVVGGVINNTQADARTPNFEQNTNTQAALPAVNTVDAIGDYSQGMTAPNLGKSAAGQKTKQALTLEAAASKGEPVAQFQLGLSHLSAGREAEAVRLIRLAADQGQAAAQYRLGKLYENGVGVTADPQTAMNLLARAAKNGNRIAMHDLGHYFATGAAGVADMKQAAHWFTMAGKRGVLDSQFNLGVLHQGDSGLPKDLVSAYMWYAVAGAQGDELASQRSKVVARELSKLQLVSAKSKVKSFKPLKVDDSANGIFRNVPWVAKAASKKQAARSNNGAQPVKTAQALLANLGYDVGSPDGDMGPRTRNAVIAFEVANGLPKTGRVNQALINRLNLAAGV